MPVLVRRGKEAIAHPLGGEEESAMSGVLGDGLIIWISGTSETIASWGVRSIPAGVRGLERSGVELTSSGMSRSSGTHRGDGPGVMTSNGVGTSHMPSPTDPLDGPAGNRGGRHGAADRGEGSNEVSTGGAGAPK